MATIVHIAATARREARIDQVERELIEAVIEIRYVDGMAAWAANSLAARIERIHPNTRIADLTVEQLIQAIRDYSRARRAIDLAVADRSEKTEKIEQN